MSRAASSQDMEWMLHHLAIAITIVVLVVAPLIASVGQKWISSRVREPRESYRYRKLLNTLVVLISVLALAVAWGRKIPQHATFFGLLGAGLAVALREPLLSVAARVAIFSGRIYQAGDRVQIGSSSGDVIDVGFFYTMILEIGNWIGGDQYSGRILQFPNAQIFGAGVFNYTRDFGYIWDEVRLPITYDSNLEAAISILLQAGRTYTEQFLTGAEQQLHRMQQYFLVPDFELKPQVYVQVTSNWVGLTMRYVVEPPKRRLASTQLYRSIFEAIQKRSDIQIASETMEITYKKADASEEQIRDTKKSAA